ncbi:threonylcarbamoyl-AMP synthase [Dissulfurispira thermophila]|uniref:L-threonylcarbamoyladenylate synthase n=2 Tax=root TaxID=1 RepID=A0A7G1GZA6_9BACT|nr:L-threonylcarbamoyladenylate synthase [Dissulfurispira thermophila]BCB95820.1 threonylcarbamoyl-AMP synthase [Dissulfurispira thermophila]
MIIKLTSKNFDKAINKAITILKNGGIIAYPTETFYGLGVKYDIDSALRRLYEIKNRPTEKTMPLIIGSKDELSLITDTITSSAIELMDRFWPGPLTILFRARHGLSEYIVSENKVAVRIPGESFALRLAMAAKFPITSTSANISGMPPADSASMVFNYFGENIDLIIDGGKTKGGLSSTIVDITDNTLKIIRHGAIHI